MMRTPIERLLETAPECSECGEHGEYVGVNRGDDDGDPAVFLRCTGCGFQYQADFPGGLDAYIAWVEAARAAETRNIMRHYQV